MRSLVRAGVPLALGSDGPLNPFLNIMLAVLHLVDPIEALSVDEAVIAYTRGSAYAQFAKHEKGSLEPGQLADLAVLSQDIFEVSPDQLPAISPTLAHLDLDRLPGRSADSLHTYANRVRIDSRRLGP